MCSCLIVLPEERYILLSRLFSLNLYCLCWEFQNNSRNGYSIKSPNGGNSPEPFCLRNFMILLVDSLKRVARMRSLNTKQSATLLQSKISQTENVKARDPPIDFILSFSFWVWDKVHQHRKLLINRPQHYIKNY